MERPPQRNDCLSRPLLTNQIKCAPPPSTVKTEEPLCYEDVQISVVELLRTTSVGVLVPWQVSVFLDVLTTLWRVARGNFKTPKFQSQPLTLATFCLTGFERCSHSLSELLEKWENMRPKSTHRKLLNCLEDDASELPSIIAVIDIMSAKLTKCLLNEFCIY